jgi:hypothetical protein
MLVGPGYLELVHEIAALPPGSRVGVVCATERGTDNIAETLALSGTKGIELMGATPDDDEGVELINRTADVVLMSREALALRCDKRFANPDRIRPWTYEFDPAGLEILRRAIDHARAGRPEAAAAPSPSPATV